MQRVELSDTIRERWPSILARSRCSVAIRPPDGPLHLLGSSTKVERGEALVAIRYLAPADLAGRESCPARSDACTALCLGHRSGRMRMDNVRRAQLWKTVLRWGDPVLHDRLAWLDIEATARRAARLGVPFAVRFDGASDTGDAERFVPGFVGLGDGRLYEYTKVSRRAFRWLARGAIDVTLSHSGENWNECRAFLRLGGRVSVVFDGPGLPDRWRGWPVVDGDAHDERWRDPGACIVGLTLKGGRTGDAYRLGLESGFIVRP